MTEQLRKATEIADESKWHNELDGQKITDILTDNRSLQELNVDELLMLVRGYNWRGKHQEGLDAVNIALHKEPDNPLVLDWAGFNLQNVNSGFEKFIKACNKQIKNKNGPAWYWRLSKAQTLLTFALGEYDFEDYEWQEGDQIYHPEVLLSIAIELGKAGKTPIKVEEMKLWFDSLVEQYEKLVAQAKLQSP